MCTGWQAAAKEAGIETVDIGAPLGLLLSVKDPVEVDMVKRAAILSNKVRYGSSVVAVRLMLTPKHGWWTR